MARFSPRARALMILGAAGLIAIVSSAWLWSSSPSYSVLFTNLSDRDGGAVIAQLSQLNLPYRNADGGTILVPADKVHEARLKLASQGLPKGSVAGSDFASSLDAALKTVSRGQEQAGELQRQFALENPNVGLEDAVVAMSKASISFAAAVQVRNRLVQAYEQIMTMQV